MYVYLSFGSNLGDREANLESAFRALARYPGIRLSRVSSVYETEPVGELNQPPFLNMAAEIGTDLEPQQLLEVVKGIEREVGRRPGTRWGPREVDIDIVLWGSRVVDSETLTIPHPEFRRRAFVLVPLAEIAPRAVDPRTGLSVAELAQRPDVIGSVHRHEPAGKEA